MMYRSSTSGFSLIELVIVIVIVSVGMVGIAKMFGNTNLSLARATDEQIVSQFAQDCAERVLQTRRDYGITSTNFATTMCDTPAIGAYSRTVALPATYTGTAAGACPNGIICRDASITVCAGSVTPCPSGATTATVNLTLVSY
jgi:prepilin-type N-terminal cleavage/methylation domain-containing protein